MPTLSALLAVLVGAAGCSGPGRSPTTQPAGVTGGDVSGITQRHIDSTSGLSSPESIVYDSAGDHYFVSNVNGPIGVQPGHGFISRLTADGTIDSLHFIVGGRNGVTLNAPMGSRIHRDTLWVLDIDMLRAFDPASGRPLRTISLASLHPHILNDFDWGPGGSIYLTDMGMYPNPKGLPQPGAPMRILTVATNGAIAAAVTSDRLDTPDGIAWDARGHRFIITPFGTNSDSVEAWAPGTVAPKGIAGGQGMFDGVEYESDGTIYVTSWRAQQVYKINGDSLVTVAKGFQTPSDVTLDTRRHRLGITDYQADAVAIVAIAGTTVASR